MSDNISVSIFMGSKSDLPVVQAASDTLNEFNVPHRMFILSAHRTPEEVVKRVKESEKNGAKVFIAAAGMAAHLAGAIAAQTTKPVLGIPLWRGRPRWNGLIACYCSNAKGRSCGNFCNWKIWSNKCCIMCGANVRNFR